MGPVDDHFSVFDLMESRQRGAKEGCGGASNNLMIDRMANMDCHKGKQNLSTDWVDVTEAYDSVESQIVPAFPLLAL